MSYISTSEPVLHQTGFLTLNANGAILASGGDLENDEKKADILFRLVSQRQKIDWMAEGCTRMSVNYKDFAYIVCLSNKKIHVVKKKLDNLEDDAYLVDTNISVNNSINA